MTSLGRYRKTQRLGSGAISQILAAGKLRRGRLIGLQTRFNDAGFARLGLIVPKRILARAVDRNRARRVLREWFRLNQIRLGARDLLIRVGTDRSDLESMVAELEHLFAAE